MKFYTINLFRFVSFRFNPNIHFVSVLGSGMGWVGGKGDGTNIDILLVITQITETFLD